MEGTYDMPYKNSYFVVTKMTTEPNQVGFIARIQIISYNFINLKHIQINSQFQKLLMLKKSDCNFLGGQSVWTYKALLN